MQEIADAFGITKQSVSLRFKAIGVKRTDGGASKKKLYKKVLGIKPGTQYDRHPVLLLECGHTVRSFRITIQKRSICPYCREEHGEVKSRGKE